MTFDELYDRIDRMIEEYTEEFDKAYGDQREYYDGLLDGLDKVQDIVNAAIHEKKP